MNRAAVKKQVPAKAQIRRRGSLLKAPVLTLVPSSARVIGYARVSRDDQVLDMQIAALRAAGVTQPLYVEKISAVNAKRPMFNLMTKFVEKGDTIVVYAFNRLFRNLKSLLIFVDDMKELGVTLRSTSEPSIDPYTTTGRLNLQVIGAVDENELNRISDRTRDGMQEKKRQGMSLGRAKMFDKKQEAQIKRDRKHMTRDEAAAKWKCSAGTIDKYAS